LSYRWVGPAAYGFTPNDTNAAKTTTVTFPQSGLLTYVVVVRDGQAQETRASVKILVPEIAAGPIAVTPANPQIVPGQQVLLSASATNQFGKTMTSGVAWTMTGPGQLIAGDGMSAVYQAPSEVMDGNRTILVTATSGARQTTVSITVVDDITASALMASTTGRYAERLSPLIVPPPFDAVAFAADPDRYVRVHEPARVWSIAAPGPGVPVISAVNGSGCMAAAGGQVTLSVRTAALAPVTYAVINGGTLGLLAARTVLSNSNGIAQVVYTAPDVPGRYRILAASPLSSGQLCFEVSVP